MTADELAALLERKREIRDLAQANRSAQTEKDALSQVICQRWVALAEYRAARSVMVYLDVRDEVRTRPLLPQIFADDKRLVIPYCVADTVELFQLESVEELVRGRHDIFEPKKELRARPEKRVDIRELDVIMVPGVAFDARGGRLGHGWGYYDKLLAGARTDTPLIGLAFECQLFPEIPTLPHDVLMNKIVTERTIYVGKGR